MLSESGKNGCPGLIPGLREKASSRLPLRMTVAVRVPSGPLIRWEKLPSSLPLVSCFYHRGVEIFVESPSAFMEMVMLILYYFLLMQCIMLTDFRMSSQPCIPWINSMCLWCILFFTYCWIRFADILLRAMDI